MRRELGLGAVVLFFLLFAVYAWTAAPNVTFHDSGELITAAVHLGIPHPPGSPLWCLTAHLFTKVPFGSWAFRVHLMSGFFGALTCVLVYLLIVDLNGGSRSGGGPSWRCHVSGLVAALLLAQAPGFWEKAVQAEMYTMNTFFLAAILVIMAKWLRGDPAGRDQDRRLVAIAALFGLGLANYQALSFFAPAIVLVVAIRKPSIFKNIRLMATLVLAGAAGLLLYLYLPIRSAANPPLDWGNPETLQNFSRVMSRTHWGALTETVHSREFMLRWIGSFDLPAQFSLPALALGVIGMVALARRERFLCLLLLLCVLIYEGWMMYMQAMTPALNPSLYYVTFYGLTEFHMPTYLILAMFMGAGALTSARWLGAVRVMERVSAGALRAAGLVAATVLVAFNFPAHLHAGNHRRYIQPHAYGVRLLDQLEPGSWIIAPGDDPQFVLCYLKFCEQMRPDVVLMKPAHRSYARLHKLAEDSGQLSGSDFVRVIGEHPEDSIEPRYHQDIPFDNEDVEVYFTMAPAIPDVLSAGFDVPKDLPAITQHLVPDGMLFRVGDITSYDRDAQTAFWGSFLSDPMFSLYDDSKHDFRERMAVLLEQHADWHMNNEEYEFAESLLTQSLAYSPLARPHVMDKKIYALVQLGQLDAAAVLCRETLELDPANKWAWQMLTRILVELEDYDGAAGCLESLLILDPEDNDARAALESLKRKQ